jgi:hypothetical protein
MPQWQVIPFRPPKGTGLTLEFGGIKLGSADIWFKDEPDGTRVGLTLYIRGWQPRNNEQIAGAVLILLDAALGEFVVETRVGFIAWCPLPDQPESHGLKPFSALPSVFDTVAH